MVTYRNSLWNVLIKLLKELKEYPYFKDSFDGKYSKRIEGIYERSLKRCNISSTDWKLILETMHFIAEKDINDEMREVFEEALTLDMQCVTSSDGVDIYRVALERLKDRKIKEENAKKIEKAKAELDEARMAREKFLADQEKTLRELEEKEIAYEEARKIIEKEQSDAATVTEQVGEVNNNE